MSQDERGPSYFTRGPPLIAGRPRLTDRRAVRGVDARDNLKSAQWPASCVAHLVSIYRNTHHVPVNAISDFAERAEPRRTLVLPNDATMLPRRKAMPANILLPGTRDWVNRLPAELRPVALCKLFPRIANALARAWSDTESANAYFADLLLDHRGGRRGFPQGVLLELIALEASHSTAHPRIKELWERET